MKNGPKLLTRYFTKDMTNRWKISTWKDVPHHMSWGQRNIKQCKIIKYLLEWQNLKHGQCQILARIQSIRDSCILLVGMYNVSATLEASLTVISKLIILLPYDLGITILGIYPKKYKYVYTKTCTWMFTDVCCKTIINQHSFNW